MVVQQEVRLVFSIRAEILTLGRELLIGKTLNTNAHWIAQQLTMMGLQVEGIHVATDSVGAIESAISYALGKHPDVLIITGGLGPTYDDLTLDGLSSALQRPKACNGAALEQIEKKYRSLALKMTPPRTKMAYMPEGSTPIPNPKGTAPGVFIEYLGTMIFSLPGVPCEMTEMFIWVAQRIGEGGSNEAFLESSVTVEGVPESSMAPIIDEWREAYPDIYIKSHPSGGEGRPTILVHLSTTGKGQNPALRLEKARDAFMKMVDCHRKSKV